MRLADVDLRKQLGDEEYDRRAPKAKRRLIEALREVLDEGRSVVLVFEGWDAAGKGGCIRRLVRGIDPRVYDVHAISAPTVEEKARHYLWRFWSKLPEPGRMAIFDRSWYGRVLVERVEGFCAEPAWRRAYDEINAFEQHLVDEGAALLKIFLHIDRKTQRKRFEERKRDPLRSWKYTDEDERNAAKWRPYREAIEEMLVRTDTPAAPWAVVPSVSKPYARLEVMEAVGRHLRGVRARR